MLRQIGVEFYKMVRKPRTYLGFAAFLIIDVLVLLGLKYGGIGGIMEHGASMNNMQVSGSPINAVFFAWLLVGSPFAFPISTVWMPFFTCVVSGEIVAGEYSDGTLRALLTRPVSRVSILMAKFIACIVYCLALAFFLGIVAYIMGWIWFGRGGLVALGTMSEPMIVWFQESEGLRRVAMAYLLTTAFAAVITSIALFISVWLNNAIGAIGGTMMLTFLLALVGEIPYFHLVKPYLYTTYVFLGQNVFLDPVPMDKINRGLVTLGIYAAVFVCLSLLIFRRKDVLA